MVFNDILGGNMTGSKKQFTALAHKSFHLVERASVYVSLHILCLQSLLCSLKRVYP